MFCNVFVRLSCAVVLLAVLLMTACPGRVPPPDGGVDVDDAGFIDAGFPDAGFPPEGCNAEPVASCPDPAPRFLDVKPIFENRCQVCHSTEGGEWPLDTYQHIADWQNEIRDLVFDCTMPPSSPKAGQPLVEMPTTERTQILAWLRCGLPL